MFSRDLHLRLGALVLLKFFKVLQLFLSAFLVLALSANGAANSVQLVLHERVDVTNSLIRLGDVVAQIEGRLEPKQLSALKTLKLKPAPLPGRAGIEITARSLGIYLRVGRSVLKEVGLTPDQVKINPEAKVTVHRKSSSVTADQLKQFVIHQVTQTLTERFPAEYQVEVNRPIRSTVFPFGKVAFSLKPIPFCQGLSHLVYHKLLQLICSYRRTFSMNRNFSLWIDLNLIRS
jgi:hypothetical protein